MNEVIQAMLTRRSVHGFKPDVPVDQAVIDRLMTMPEFRKAYLEDGDPVRVVSGEE